MSQEQFKYKSYFIQYRMVSIPQKTRRTRFTNGLKDELNLETHDDVVKIMPVRTKKSAPSLFGKLKYVKKKFERRELSRF